MNQLDYAGLSNQELIPLLELPIEHDGLRYYIPKAEKIELLTTDVTDERFAEILTAARTRQREHHTNLSHRRAHGPVDKAKAIEGFFAGKSWVYVEQLRPAGGFRDEATGRKAVLAFVLRNVASGTTHKFTRATVEQAHQQLRNVTNWPPPRGRRPAKEAHAAGVITASSLV